MSDTGRLNKKRDANFELLRIIAMLMIITLHYNSHSGALLELGVPASKVQLFASIIEGFCISGLNVYVLLSGYFLSQSSVKPSRIIKLISQVYFYTILISITMVIAGVYVVKSNDSVFKTLQYLFPVSSEHYWFVSAYVIMYVFAPVMNAAVNTLSRKKLKAIIIGLLIWFCFIKSIIPVMFATDHYGYDYGWFICLYLIAAYIRKYNVVLFFNAKRSALVYLISSLVIGLMSIGLYYFNYRFGGLIYYSDVPYHYNFIFTLLGSLGLFSVFRFYRMKENRLADVVRFVGPLTFGVYLLHMHLEIRDRWLLWIEQMIGKVPMDSVPFYAWHMIRTIVIVFITGIFIDWIRKMFFDYVERVMHNSWLSAKIRKWDDELC
ncbi:acyltransferase [Butyrivibrio sp. YAB3001]|uniref:acyltransferase n=1 Tax=Butyrivibrio sp. YAB3001 TaxID=1520812 RepID=UPI0008F62ADE|nr:acyltransferase [Butyrivibrio sp. YAB3001]SFC16842.1 Surface polysaccharide O-acyltransferase, integral membrane enzyme [Butyrivibrio sp. YAB3001]